MYLIVDGLVRLLAPILPVTTDELWRALPGAPRRVGASDATSPADLESWRDEALVERWRQLIDVRGQVNAAIEEQRQQKVIGTSLEAQVSLTRARRDARPAAPPRRGPADAVHRLGGRASTRRRTARRT